MQVTYAPLRTLRDIEELERVPLDERIFSWNLNDWIARGCALDPAKIAIRYIADGDPDGETVAISYRELQKRSNQAANLFHSLGVSANDVVLYVLPTLPQLYVAMLGAVSAGIACGVNWMLKPEQLAELVRSTKAKVVVTLGPTPGYEIFENVQAVRAEISPSVHILTVPGPGGTPMPETDFDTLAARQPGDRLLFERKIAPDDIAAYVHSGGTTGSPKAGDAHASRLCLQVLGQRCRDGAYVGRRDLFRLSHVPHRWHFRARLFRHRARHVDRHPVAARRTRQALHRELLEVRGEVRDHDLLRRADDAGATRQERTAAARSSRRCATMPAPVRRPSRPRWRGRSRS